MIAGSALSALVGAVSICLVFTFYLASLDIPSSLSRQGCRMSWMSPSYILQSDFNASWTPLAKRYSLWLYREVGWDINDQVRDVHISTSNPFTKAALIAVEWVSCVVHSWKCRFFPSSSIYRFFGDASILLLSL